MPSNHLVGLRRLVTKAFSSKLWMLPSIPPSPSHSDLAIARRPHLQTVMSLYCWLELFRIL